MFRRNKRAAKEQVSETLKILKGLLNFEDPFPGFSKNESLKPEDFIQDLNFCLKDTIEEYFCAKVQTQQKDTMLVVFDTGECYELQLTCKSKG